jgi:phosphoribosylformylglycinamidine cyclo-ligase
MAHITGGGLVLNVPRMLPDGVQARLSRSAWPRAAIFDWLQRQGNVAADEMHRVFNCGLGMVLAVAAHDVAAALAFLGEAGETAYDVGEIVARPAGAPGTVVA